MRLPTCEIEKRFGTDKLCIGIDEAGRGPLAGPVVAAAAWVNPRIFDMDFKEKKLIRDSKTLSKNQRASIFKFIENSEDFIFGIGEVSHLIIDRINILNATLLAMRVAVENIKYQISNIKTKNQNLKILKTKEESLYLLVDGNKRIPKIKDEQKLFAGGDERVFSISVASICAKVHRDSLMLDYDKKYPGYGFEKHKGYGTKDHLHALKRFGPCDIHRKSFRPVSQAYKSEFQNPKS